MSKELKPCHLLDRLREWFELYGNQNHERAEKELHLAINELYKYQQKDKTIADLEAKLAEKEKEIEEVKQTRTQILNFGKRTKKVVISNPYGEDCVVYNQEDQDKISFCIEQLEKVKEYVNENESWEIEGSDYSIVYADDVLEEIDNQIKQLKDMK